MNELEVTRLHLEKSLRANQCHHFLDKKRRFCRMRQTTKTIYCAEHEYLHQDQETKILDEFDLPSNLLLKNDTASVDLRIPCPLDPYHTVLMSNLEKHLKRCNSREKEKLCCFDKNVNISLAKVPSCSFRKAALSTKPLADLLASRNLFEEFVNLIDSSIKKIKDVSKVYTLDPGMDTIGKHEKQQDALIRIIQEKGLLARTNQYIEFGAGKGRLARSILDTLYSSEDMTLDYQTHFVLIDRENSRKKSDAAIRQHKNARLTRLFIDIKDLNLSLLNVLDSNSPIVAVSKHLCGAATDLAINCILNFKNFDKNATIGGFVIALCCHQKCEMDCFVNKRALYDFGFVNEQQFAWLRALSSWAVCGDSKLRSDENENVSLDNEKTLHVSISRREEIGRHCKWIINYARQQLLESLGFDATLVNYVSPSVSLENVALVAVPKKKV